MTNQPEWNNCRASKSSTRRFESLFIPYNLSFVRNTSVELILFNKVNMVVVSETGQRIQ